MTSEAPFGSGGRNRDFPALAPDVRQAIVDSFNDDNHYFPGTTYMIKPMSEVTNKSS